MPARNPVPAVQPKLVSRDTSSSFRGVFVVSPQEMHCGVRQIVDVEKLSWQIAPSRHLQQRHEPPL